MTRPTKRQRLTIAQHDNVAGLERARHANDMRLKSEFEAIFAKYSKDFSEIGDEIDLKTGEIVVDNGHLATMRHELDVGVEVGSPGATGWGDEEQDFRYNGHGNVESMGEDDDADSMLAPDDEADDGTIEEQTTSGWYHEQPTQPPLLSSANCAAWQALSQSISAQIAQFLSEWQQPQKPAADPLWVAPPLPLQPPASTRCSGTTCQFSAPSLPSTFTSKAANRPSRGDPQSTSSSRHEWQSVWATAEPRKKSGTINRRDKSAAEKQAEPPDLEEVPTPAADVPDAFLDPEFLIQGAADAGIQPAEHASRSTDHQRSPHQAIALTASRAGKPSAPRPNPTGNALRPTEGHLEDPNATARGKRTPEAPTSRLPRQFSTCAGTQFPYAPNTSGPNIRYPPPRLRTLMPRRLHEANEQVATGSKNAQPSSGDPLLEPGRGGKRSGAGRKRRKENVAAIRSGLRPNSTLSGDLIA